MQYERRPESSTENQVEAPSTNNILPMCLPGSPAQAEGNLNFA